MADDEDPLWRLAERARTHDALASDSRPARDAAIYDAYDAGCTYRQLAGRTGMSTSAVHRAVLRETKRRQLLAGDDDEMGD